MRLFHFLFLSWPAFPPSGKWGGLVDRTKFVGGKKASEIIGVHQRTLYLWDKKGLIETIRTIGNKRLYNVEKYLKEKICNDENKEKNIILCDDLDKLDKEIEKLNILLEFQTVKQFSLTRKWKERWPKSLWKNHVEALKIIKRLSILNSNFFENMVLVWNCTIVQNLIFETLLSSLWSFSK